MKILIAEDDLASRRFLSKFLTKFGQCDVTVDGMETVEAFMSAWDEKQPYDLICLDIMMPKLDGLKVLKVIRDLEIEKKVESRNKAKIIMMTALNDKENVMEAFGSGCEAYAAKPIDIQKLTEVLNKFGFKAL